MKNTDDLVREWFAKAFKDKLSAQRERMFDEPVLESVCFHAQQAAEKMLKGYCVFHSLTPPRTHDIAAILQCLKAQDPDAPEALKRADDLSDYSVDIRYPEAPSQLRSEDAGEALDILGEVESYLRAKIPATILE